jgi:hypothetical protein
MVLSRCPQPATTANSFKPGRASAFGKPASTGLLQIQSNASPKALAAAATAEDGGVDTSTTQPSRSGQAMIEVIVGLVAMVVLIAGLIQIVKLTRAQTEAMIDAREMVGALAFDDDPLSAFPGYIEDVEVGPDGRTYTGDDTTSDANAGEFDTRIVRRLVSPDNEANEWDTLDALPSSAFTSLHESLAPSTEFGLLRGQASTTIPTDPAIRQLLYNADEIEVECEVWMTWTRGIY